MQRSVQFYINRQLRRRWNKERLAGSSPDAKLWKDIPTKLIQGEWRIVHLRAIHDADAVVALGGSAGSTQTAIYSAELLSKPTVLIPTFGGTASDNWGYFRGRYYKDNEADNLAQPWENRAADTAKAIVVTIGSIAKRQVNSRTSPLEHAMLGLVALISLALWMYVMFAAPQFFPPALALGILLGTASISGSVLRLVFGDLGAFPTEWSQAHTIMSIILGLLIGFGLLLAGGFANLSLNGKMMTIETYDDARTNRCFDLAIAFSSCTVFGAGMGTAQEKWAEPTQNP